MPLTREQFHTAIGRSAPWLRLTLRRLIGDLELAEELLQNTYMAAWRKREQFVGNDDAAARWLHGIARNEFRAFARAEGRRRRLKEAVMHELETKADQSWEPPDLGELNGCVKALPPLKQRIISMFYGLEGIAVNHETCTCFRLTDAQIAQLLSFESRTVRSPGSVTMLRVRALADLRTCLAKKLGGFPDQSSPSAVPPEPTPGDDSRNHASGYQLIRLYATPELPVAKTAASHVERCEICRSELRALAAVEDLLFRCAWDRAFEAAVSFSENALPAPLRHRLEALSAPSPQPPRDLLETARPPGIGPLPQVGAAIAATLLLTTGLWQALDLSDALEIPGVRSSSPGPADGPTSSPPPREAKSPSMRGAARTVEKPRPPLELVAHPRPYATGRSPGSPGFGRDVREVKAEPAVLSALPLEDGRWRIDVPEGSEVQLYVVRPPFARTWFAELRCTLPSGEPFPPDRDQRTVWRAATDSPEPEMAVGSPFLIDTLALPPGGALSCIVWRNGAAAIVDIRPRRIHLPTATQETPDPQQVIEIPRSP